MICLNIDLYSESIAAIFRLRQCRFGFGEHACCSCDKASPALPHIASSTVPGFPALLLPINTATAILELAAISQPAPSTGQAIAAILPRSWSFGCSIPEASRSGLLPSSQAAPSQFAALPLVSEPEAACAVRRGLTYRSCSSAASASVFSGERAA